MQKPPVLVAKRRWTLLAQILRPLLKAHGLTALWAHKPLAQPIWRNKTFFKLLTKPVCKHLLANKVWQALFPVLANLWQLLRLAQVRPRQILPQALLAQHRARPPEHKPLLMQPGQTFKAHKQVWLPRVWGA